MEFTGEYIHTLDSKGRLIVPTKFRELLGNEFFITRGLDGCLFVYPQEEWKEFSAKLRSLPLMDDGARKLTRFFAAGATACEVDKQGRILVPATLREFAELEKEVVLAGMVNRVEIWSKERWANNNIFSDAEMKNAASHLNSIGFIL